MNKKDITEASEGEPHKVQVEQEQLDEVVEFKPNRAQKRAHFAKHVRVDKFGRTKLRK